MRDIFVVAGNHREFQFLVQQAHVQWDFELRYKMVHYVSNVRMLVETKGARVFVYGTYFKRKDWPEIELYIGLNGHRKLTIR